MAENHLHDDVLCDRAMGGDEGALALLFAKYRQRLRTMVQLRLDRRLQGRVDPSDVIQEAFIDLSRELPSYARKRHISLHLWMRLVTGQRLNQIHRLHLHTEMRDASREISIHGVAIPLADSVSLAAEIVGNDTSAVSAAIRSEVQQQLHEALNGMDPLDQEIIALRNFEELDNCETAEVLGLTLDAARKRYVRALKRLQNILDRHPGLIDR